MGLYTRSVADRTFSFLASSGTHRSPSLSLSLSFSPLYFPSVENIEHLKKKGLCCFQVFGQLLPTK